MTIVDHDVLDKLSNMQKSKLQPTNLKIVNACGEQMATEGKIRVNFQIADMKMNGECNVVTHL